ncbi:MAG: hypothetical protein R3E96_07330 [Planctomycetota bacterium]
MPNSRRAVPSAPAARPKPRTPATSGPLRQHALDPGHLRPLGPGRLHPRCAGRIPAFWDLACLAFGADGLDAAAAHSYTWTSSGVPKTAPNPNSCAGELHHRGPIASGYAFFLFDPIPESRWKRYRAVLHMPKNGRIVGTDSGPAYLAYHGLGEVSANSSAKPSAPTSSPAAT